MLGSQARLAQRYLVPRPLVSLIYYARYRALVSPLAKVQYSGRVVLGRGTVVKPFAVIQTHTGLVRIGRDSAVSSFNHISTATGDVLIGDHVRFGPHVTVVGATRAFRDRTRLIVDQGTHPAAGVTIEDDVLVGANAVVLPGVTVGRGAVIGAGTVVNEDVEPYAIVAGSPARVVGHRT